MSNLHVFPDLALAREEAAAWVARIDRGLSAEERVAFDAWRINPANARALGELSGLWNGMDEMRVLAEVFPPREKRAGALPGRLRLAALAASVLAGVLAVGFLVTRDEPSSSQETAMVTAQRYTTAIGQQRSIALGDGSVIALNTDTEVDVAFGPNARDLHLLRGEAHFTVAHDAVRPFRVRVDGRTVMAVGTAFGVRLHENQRIEVIVTEGRVKVLDEDRALLDGLDRGHAAWIGAENAVRVQQLDGEVLASRLAWRNGMLVFDGETLETALQEFARYSTDEFSVSDPSLLQQRIGGYFPAGDTEALIEALRGNFGLDVQRDANGQIRIGPG